jgi:cysteine desulfuration protein SufE
MEEYVSLFSEFPDWFAKYEYLTSVALAMDKFPEKLRTEENTVKGCQTQTWLALGEDNENGDKKFFADSNSMLIKGILGIVIDVIENMKSSEIEDLSVDFLEDLGITQNLEDNRNVGLGKIFDRFKELYIAKHKGLYKFCRKEKGEKG